jgi:hypothetical protein
MWGKHYPTVKQRIKGVRVKAIVRDWYMQGMPDEKSNINITSLKAVFSRKNRTIEVCIYQNSVS